MRRIPQTHFIRIFVAACGFLIGANNALAATETWVGNTSPFWSSGGWTGGNNPPGGGDTLVFGAAGIAGTTLQNDLPSDTLIGSGNSTNAFVFNASAPEYVINSSSNAFTLNGNIINNSSSTRVFNNLIYAANVDLTFSGGGGLLFGSGGAFVNDSSNVITINNAGLVTFAGGINTLSNSAHSLIFAGTSDIVVSSAPISQNSGAVTLKYFGAREGAGTLTLSALNNSYTGGTRVAGGGTLLLDYSTSGGGPSFIGNIVPSTGTVTLGGDGGITGNGNGLLSGGTLNIKGRSGTLDSQTFGALALAAKTSSSIRVNENGAIVNLSLAGITRSSGSALDLTLPISGTITTTSTNRTGTNGILTAGSAAYATVDGATWATIPASGTSRTIGALASGSYQVDLFAASGDTDIQANDSPSAFTNNTLRFNTPSKTLVLNSSGSSTVTSGGILVTSSGSGSVIASGGGSAALRPGSTAKEIVVHDYADLTISASIVDNGGNATALTHVGTGITTFTGTNTYTGVTTIGSGTAKFGKVIALYGGTTTSWTTANITVGSGATIAFNVGGGGEFSSADISAFLTRMANPAGNDSGLSNGSLVGFDTTNASGGTFAYGGSIANPITTAIPAVTNVIGLTKLGAGNLVLSGANTYTGTTRVSSGALVVNSTHSGGSYRVTGTLAGTGVINPSGTNSVTINSGGIVAPGDAAQTSVAAQTGTLAIGRSFSTPVRLLRSRSGERQLVMALASTIN